jgi:hypothetical protein
MSEEESWSFSDFKFKLPFFRRITMKIIITGLLSILLTIPTYAQEVGRQAAAKYMQKAATKVRGEQTLALHYGKYMNSQSYVWGEGSSSNPAQSTYGLTYFMSDWSNFDMSLRVDFNEYELQDQKPMKMSLLPLWTFPRAEAGFPLYFGLGLGVGAFFRQLPNESNLSLDYQLVAGARLMDVFEAIGFLIEFGMKNHLNLLSDGQFNSVFVAAGVVFSF